MFEMGSERPKSGSERPKSSSERLKSGSEPISDLRAGGVKGVGEAQVHDVKGISLP